jgi:3-isopropylmalate dehydrogenase
MNPKREFSVAVFPGDGIGVEIMQACLVVLHRLQACVGGFELAPKTLTAGAKFYTESGIDITEENLAHAEGADAILLGAMGLPDVRYPDGTEISPHLKMRAAFDLYAGPGPGYRPAGFA